METEANGADRQQSQTADVSPMLSPSQFTGRILTFNKLTAWLSGFALIATGFLNIFFIIAVYGEAGITASTSESRITGEALELRDYYWFPYLVSSHYYTRAAR